MDSFLSILMVFFFIYLIKQNSFYSLQRNSALLVENKVLYRLNNRHFSIKVVEKLLREKYVIEENIKNIIMGK